MQTLRDRNGKVIGTLRPISGEMLRLHNRDGIMQGWYNPKNDNTYDRNGKLVGRGNTVIALLVNKD